MDNDFQSSSKIKPFAPSDSVAERFGNGRTNSFTLKIPLTENSIGYFDIDEVLGARNADRQSQSFMTRVVNGFKRSLFNIIVGLGIKNKMKFTSFFEIPAIDSKYVESARIRKVFFTTEDCRPEETDCDDYDSKASNFNFVDKFFVNIASDEAPEGEISDDELIQEVDDKEFDNAVTKSFAETVDSADAAMDKTKREESLVQGNEINILKFENNVPYLNLNPVDIKPTDRDLTLHATRDRGKITRYLRGESFQDLIKSVRRRRKEIYITLRDDVEPSVLFERISKEQSPLTQKMIIFRLDGRYIEAKKYFQQERFNKIVKDTTMIGRSMFVELHDVSQKEKFFEMIDDPLDRAEDAFDIYKVQKCASSNCLDLDALPVNMAPLLTSGKDVRIDTWLSIRALGSVDFKYNGYIEVEVVLKNLPL